MFYEEFILKRHPENPIIGPKDFPGAEAIMNPGQTIYDGKTILLVSIIYRSGYYRGKEGAATHVAESTDGVHFKINTEPFLQGIDTRVTKLEDTYYIIHPVGDNPAYPTGDYWGTFAALGKTKSHILAPYEPYELSGIVPNVVFTCGAIPDYDKDQIRVYYGCADTCIGLAIGSLSELVDACKKFL